MNSAVTKPKIAFFVWAFSLFCALLLSFLLFEYGFKQGQTRATSENSIKAYTTDLEARLEALCSDFAANELVSCIQQNLEQTNEHIRAENDLVAQTEMARWTLLMLAVSIITATISALGVWFIKRTLEATEAALRDTAAATEAMHTANTLLQLESRPWVDIEMSINGPLKYQPESETFHLPITLTLQNRGKNPAFHVVHSSSLEILKHPLPSGRIGPSKPFITELQENSVRRSKSYNMSTTIFVDRPVVTGWSLTANPRKYDISEDEEFSLCYCIAIAYGPNQSPIYGGILTDALFPQYGHKLTLSEIKKGHVKVAAIPTTRAYLY